MNKLTNERRAAVIQALCEGNSVRATCRLTGTAKGTVLKLLTEIGEACRHFHHKAVRGIKAKRVQVDEVWSFCYAKARNVPIQMTGEAGDIWTWAAIDEDSKLTISWHVGARSKPDALYFLRDLKSRLATRIQLTSDGNNFYPGAVEQAFGWDKVDYSILVKYFKSDGHSHGKYSPGVCTGVRRVGVLGNPDSEAASTSHVERLNLTLRMQNRRMTRLTNGFSKKAENHAYATALQFVFYNWCRPHHTLTQRRKGIHTTPAMAAGLTSRVWTVGDLVKLIDPGYVVSVAG